MVRLLKQRPTKTTTDTPNRCSSSGSGSSRGGRGLLRYLGVIAFVAVFLYIGRLWVWEDDVLPSLKQNLTNAIADTVAVVVKDEPPQPEQGSVEQLQQPPEQKSLDWTPLFNDSITDPWKQNIYAQLDRVREKCGALCGINSLADYEKRGITDPTGRKQYKTFQTPIDCQKLFEMEEIDAGDASVPYPVPEELKHLYSLDGAIPILYSWGKQSKVQLGKKAPNVWTVEQISKHLNELSEGRLQGTYKARNTNHVRDRLMQQGGLAGKTVLVVGSQTPWVEVIALHAGAAHVTTLEYGVIESQHPQITTMTPDVFRKSYFEGKLPQFDAVLSYSSLEHSGLGRYGDALNPWGDILSLARCWCVAKDDAMLLLGTPVGQDRVEFNAHRVYGNIRLPLLTTNWVAIDGATDYTRRPHLLGLHFFRKQSEPS